MYTLTEFLVVSEAVAAVVAAAIVGWYYWKRPDWDAETAHLKTRGLPWIVLLVFTVPLIYCVACLAGASLGHRSGVFALILLSVVVMYSRRVSAEKRWGKRD